MLRYMITDRRLAGGAEPLVALVARRMGEGVDYVQIREKDLEARALYELTRAVLALPRGVTRVLVNSRVDVALAAGADGVHLPSGSPAPEQFRTICPPGFLLGASCHSPEEVRRCRADYCLFAPVFAPLSKQDARPPVGIEGLRSAAAAATIPVFALGGVTRANEPLCEQAGAAGVAGISYFL